jgi:hypothetical protein
MDYLALQKNSAKLMGGKKATDFFPHFFGIKS